MRQEELTIHKALPADGDWKSLLFQPLPERDHYETAQYFLFLVLPVRYWVRLLMRQTTITSYMSCL